MGTDDYTGTSGNKAAFTTILFLSPEALGYWKQPTMAHKNHYGTCTSSYHLSVPK